MPFASFKYHISPSFPSHRIEELKHVLDRNGASEVGNGEGWLKEVNLVVSNSMRFEGWEEVKERNERRKTGEEAVEEIYVVTDKWVDRSLVLGKTQSPYHYSPDPSLIFSGIIACATSLPPSDLEVLSAGITALGGQWRTGLTKDVTHLFAISPDSQKYATAMHFREETGVKIILPHWFDDAVRLGMGGLSTDVYEWPDPEMLRNPLVGGGQELSGAKKNMYAMAALFTAPMHESSSPALKDLQMAAGAGSRMEVDIWKGKRIVLSRTLQLFERRREAVEAGIKRAGGVVVRYGGDEEVDEGFGVIGGTGSEELSKREKERRKNEADTVSDCDVLVTRWRDGTAYVVALRSHKTIGTLAWLFHVQSTGTLTRPLDQLLHYPVPKRPIEAFSNHVVTVTNYTGEAREYLKKLIIAMGAKFTPSMSGQNTVLIAAYISGTKATKAQSWSIPIVNHTWLEDCFIQWRNLTVGLEKYIGFPTGVDFSKLLGVRGVGGALDAEGLDAEVDAEEGGEAPHGTDASVKEVQGLIASEDVDMVDGRREVPVPVMDEDERTPTKKVLTSQPKVNGTSPLSVPTSSRISPEKLVSHDDLEADEEEPKTNGKQKQKPKNLVSSPENEEKSTRIRERKKTNKTLPSSSEDEIQAADDDESEIEMVVPPKVKANSKAKEKQVQPRSGKPTTRDEDDSEFEVVWSKVSKTDLNAKGKGKEKVSARPKKSKKDDEEDEDEDMEREEASKKKTHSKDRIKVQRHSTNSNPKSKTRGQDEDAMEEDEEEDDGEEENPKSNGVVEVGKKRKVVVDDDNEDDEAEEGLESEDELSLPIPYTPPPKAKNAKLIRRVSQVVLPDADVGVHSQEDKEQGKEKPRLSLIDKSQAGKRDARTRVRKRKSEVVEAEVDEQEEQEEPVIFDKSSSSKRKTKAKTASTSASASVKVKGKEKSRVHHSDSEEEEEEAVHKPQPQKTTKKSVKESKPPVKTKTQTKPRLESLSDDDDDDDAEEEVEAAEQPSDSDSDLPAAPVLSLMNGKKDKRVSSGSTPKSTLKKKPVVSISAPVAKSTKSKGRGRGTMESENDDGNDVHGATPKRAISVLMPSFNLSPNKKGGASAGVKEVEKSRKGKKAKLSVSSEEEEDDKTHDEELVSPRTRAITRTDSIRVMSNHHVQVSTKYSGRAVSGSVKKNISAVASSSKPKSKPKSKPAPMDIDDDDDSPSPPSPSRVTRTAMKSNNTQASSPTTKTPFPPVKRSAAAKATQRLHDTIMPDLVQFESQMKRANAKGRKSGGMHAFKIESEGSGGKRSQVGDGDENGEERVKKRRRVDDDDGSVSVNAKGKGKRKGREGEEEQEEQEEQEKVGAKKRSSSKGKGKTVVIVASDKEAEEEAEEEEEEEEEDVVVVSSKGTKTKTKSKEKEVETPSKSGVVLLTTQVTLSDEVIRTLIKLGVKMTSRPSECTHLLAPQLVRTEKFLCALVVAPFILTEKWATRSAAVKKLLPEKGFALHDSTGENKYGVDLMQSLRRAKELDGKLLAGKTFYVTPKIPVDTKLLKNVVNACGGQVTTQPPTIRIINASPENRHVISCKEDIAIWRPMAAQGIPIYSQELVLTGVLKQEMEWDGDGVRVDV